MRRSFEEDRERRTSRSDGFTLIEVLIVVVVLGVLAGVAIPRFSNTAQKGSDAAAITDLRNAMSAQEAYLLDNQSYTDLGNLTVSTSTGVLLGGGGSAGGYFMTARHSVSPATYQVVVGSGANEGRIVRQ